MPHLFEYVHRGIATRVSAPDEGILRITRTRRDAFLDGISPVVTCTARAEGALQETPEEMIFATGLLTVRVSRRTGALRFYDDRGVLLLREPDRRPFLLQEKPKCKVN